MGRYRNRQEVIRRGLDRNQNGKKNGDEEQDDRITINKILKHDSMHARTHLTTQFISNHVREAREEKTRGRKMSRDWGNKRERRVRSRRPDGQPGIYVTQAPWAKGTKPPRSVPAPPAGPRQGEEQKTDAEPAVI